MGRSRKKEKKKKLINFGYLNAKHVRKDYCAAQERRKYV